LKYFFNLTYIFRDYSSAKSAGSLTAIVLPGKNYIFFGRILFYLNNDFLWFLWS